MKKSELKDKIKEMILKEMESNNMEDAPENEVDFLAEIEGMLSEENGLTPLQDYVYQYEIEISGEDEAQEFLDDIKKYHIGLVVVSGTIFRRISVRKKLYSANVPVLKLATP